jgi:hypothetical protein
MVKIVRVSAIIVINLAVLAGLLALIEIGFRLSDRTPQSAGATIQWLEFAPFVMFHNPYIPGGTYNWDDVTHGRTFVGKIINNQAGFAMREEVDFSRVRPKAPNERVVIFTGGSTAWGVGSTSNETTVAGRLQAILNESQTQYRYTVLNLAMGGWISVQQFIALALYGRNLQPDWLVAMDGLNDAAVSCAHSQGAAHTMHYWLMEVYMKGYVFGQLHPVLYRGWLENELIKHSVAYRKLTGQTPVNLDVHLDTRDPGTGRSVIRPTPWSDLERQLELYLQTESQMVDLFPRAKAILSTQPLPFNFESVYGRVYQDRGTPAEATATADLKKQLDGIRETSKGRECGLDMWNNARDWFMPTSALRLEAVANQYAGAGREVHYVNTGALFPNHTNARNNFFIDPAHLNDAGADVVARLYAETILASDLPDRFANPQWAGKPLPDSAPGSSPAAPGAISIVEATYGLNCKDFKVPAFAQNRVRVGNASDVAADACTHKQGKCSFAVDVARLGDPANSCKKDFSIKWRCGPEKDVHEAYLPAEANGNSISLNCPAN